jgi:phytol kinase
MLDNNLIALALTFVTSLAWLRLNDLAAHRGLIPGQLSRKIIHIGTGPIFVLFWLLFTEAPSARYLAALVPLAFTIQFTLIGLSILRDDAAVQAMSRSGDPREILRGPLFYGIVFVVLTIVYWRESPIGITALMLLCGGDGLADVVGRRWGKTSLPWTKRKTWAGSMAMFLGGWSFATGVLFIYHLAGVHPGSFLRVLPGVTLIAALGTIVEALPLRDVDNLTVTFSAVLLGHWLF